MIHDALVYLGALLMLAGALFGLIAALGVLRLPDLASRAHAASKAGLVGGGFVLLALVFLSFDGSVAVRAVLGIVFLVLTTPVAAHLLVRSCYQSDEKMRTYLSLDEADSEF